jgi:phage protein D
MPTSDQSAIAPVLSVKIGGSRISDVLAEGLTEIEVENDLHVPDVATLRFHLNDTDGDVANLPDVVMKDYLQQGVTLEVFHVVKSKEKRIFSGEVTSVSLEYSMHEPGGPMLAAVQAFSRSHRLHRGRKTRSFTSAKASEVASKIAQEHGLTPKVKTTAGVYERLFQSRQTDWEFLRQLAGRVGYDVYVVDKELHFEPRGDSSSPVELEWGQELVQFRVRANTAFQTPEVTVRGWDWEKQQALIGKASTGKGAPKIGEGRSGTAQAKAAFGDAALEITNLSVETQDEAQKAAQAAADEIAMGHIYAEGTTAQGMGELLPGAAVQVKGVGKRFSGAYSVTAATHRYTGWGGYTTTFVIGGRKPNTLTALVENGGAASAAGQINGVVVGVVSNIEDPKDLSRVKVAFPSLADKQESDWVRRATPDAGPTRGVQWTPEVGDEVLVAFEHGDLNRPYILGSLWNGKSAPPLKTSEAASGGKVKQRVIQSKAGHVVILDDTDGAEKIVIRDKTKKNEVEIDSKTNAITITSSKDLTIKASGKVDISNSTGDVSIACQNFSVSATQKCDLSAQGDVSVKGLNAAIQAQVNASVKGNAQASLEASGQTVVKGAMVMIN